MSATQTLSVAVPTIGRPERFEPMLHYLAAQRGEVHDVVVAVDAYLATCEAIPDARASIPRIALKSGALGRPGAWSVGPRPAAGDVLLSADEDVLVAHDSLHRLACLVATSVHPVTGEIYDIVAVAGIDDERLGDTLRLDRLRRDGFSPDGTRMFRSPIRRASAIVFADKVRYRRLRFLAAVGAFVGVHPGVFDEAGGDDEEIRLDWGCEGLRLGWRLQVLGAVFAWLECVVYQMTHRRPERWSQHAVSLDRFRSLHAEPEAEYLRLLLCDGGRVSAYLRELGPGA
jgi:hypothetical protein